MKSPFDVVAERWRAWKGATAGVSELDCCGGEEAKHIARDIGVSAPELRALAGKWPSSTNLLSRRLAALELDENAIERKEPAVLRDLKRLCALCSSTDDCKHDLARNPSDPVWHVYCPNVMTLEALAAERGKLRKAN